MENKVIKDLKSRMDRVLKGGGDKAVAKQKEMGKFTARERISLLLDKGSFFEYDTFVEHDVKDFGMQDKFLAGDGVIIGTGTINDKPIAVFSQDFTVAGGSLGFMHAKKITKIMDYALSMRIPLIGINDSGGARIQEGVNALAGYGEIFYRNTMASGVIPQISVILGPCAGGAVYSPALTDFVFVVDNISKMFITGPSVIETVLGEKIDAEELGGARVHCEVTGNAHFFAKTEKDCFKQIRDLLSKIPQNNTTKSPNEKPELPLKKYNIDKIVPLDSALPYDVRDIIKSISDKSDFFEVMEMFAANIVVGFGRIEGELVGYVANQPMVMAGVLDCDSSDKASRFIRYCDAFNIPVVTLEDLPGYLPGVDQEHAGVIRHGAKLLYAYSEATVPKITVIIRKAYGGGYIAMGSKHLRADFVMAWPNAEIAVMGPEGAANIIFLKEIKGANNPDEVRKAKIEEYKEKFANPYIAAGRGYVDAIIEPSLTRTYIAHALKMSKNKVVDMPSKKHGIIPL